jgi:hypothetical protein
MLKEEEIGCTFLRLLPLRGNLSIEAFLFDLSFDSGERGWCD